VLSYSTGSLPEIISGDAGRVVPYGSNYWNLEPADIPTLAKGAVEILSDQAHFRQNARLRAEEAFGLAAMAEKYCKVLFE